MKTHPHAPKSDAPGVLLAAGLSGSGVFHKALLDAIVRFPELQQAHVPADKQRFKAEFAEALVRFEVIRAASPDRIAIARQLSQSLEGVLLYGLASDEGHNVPLAAHLALPRELPTLTRHAGTAQPGWTPDVTFHGVRYRGHALRDLLAVLRRDRKVTESAFEGLSWVADRLDAEGRLVLTGERFAILGAGAELAPTPMLLEAGAEVLWIDRAPPDRYLSRPDSYAGTLVTSAAGDIIADPGLVKAAVQAFAAGTPVHLGLFAYAPGRGRELRLAASMDAIARSLGAAHVRSIALFVSPTTPGEMPPEELAVARDRLDNAQLWKKALLRARLLDAPGWVEHGGAAMSRSVVPLQGLTYQAAQYLAKMMAAESLAVDGLGGAPVTVSANVAGITATKSLEHPLFQAGFLGSPRFGIEIFEPAVTRTLSGLLMVQDLLNPQAPGAPTRSLAPNDKGRAVATQAIHGGVRTLSWGFDRTIRVSAVLGLGKKPSLALGLLPGKKKGKKGPR